jgi:hypothetical protein
MGNNIILTGTSNNGFRHRYSFRKTPKIKNLLENLFLKLNLVKEPNQPLIKNIFIEEIEDDNGEEIIVQKEIQEFVDEIYHFQNKEFDLDLFFGKEKVILLIRSNKRFDFIKFLEKNSNWISKEEAEKIRNEKRKRFNKKIEKIIKT